LKKVSGQALNNGVMMISNKVVILVRNSEGNLKETVKEFSFSNNKIPVIRGFLQLFNQLKNGLGAFYFSAKYSKNKKNIVFLVLLILSYYIYPYFIDLSIFGISNWCIDILFIVSLFLFLGFSKSVRNTLKYHGAEHKTVNCYEDNGKLTVENVKKYPKEHIRCGTSMMVAMIFLSLIFESIIYFLPEKLQLLGYIILFPLIIGLSYEFMIIVLKKQKNKFSKLFIKIGLKAQKITTKEPNDDQIEVAIEALKRAIN
jgi:uncharacterized protein YqhQ